MSKGIDPVAAAACAAQLGDGDIAAIGCIEVFGKQPDRSRPHTGHAAGIMHHDVAEPGRAVFHDDAVAGLTDNIAGRIDRDISHAILDHHDAVCGSCDHAGRREHYIGRVASYPARRREVDRVSAGASDAALTRDREIAAGRRHPRNRSRKAKHVVELERVAAPGERDGLSVRAGKLQGCSGIDDQRSGSTQSAGQVERSGFDLNGSGIGDDARNDVAARHIVDGA